MISDKLIAVAVEFEDEGKFQSKAREVAEQIPFNSAEKLIAYFHDSPPMPIEIQDKVSKYGLLGVWMNICQNAIFEILYNYGDKAIPLLYKIGFGEYDWTQYKAIDVLCRLANDGINSDQIVRKIGEEIKKFRYEAIFPSMESLARIKSNPIIPSILFSMFGEFAKEDPIDGLYILELMSSNYPIEAKRELEFIQSLSEGKGIENRSPILDGAVLSFNEKGEEVFSINKEENIKSHRERAQKLFNKLK